jgi:thiol-disulfide isomerase/thioredoxin
MKKKLLALSLISLISIASIGCSNTSEKKETARTNETDISKEQKRNTANQLDFESLFPNEEVREYAKKMIGTKAPDFTLKNLKGEEFQLSKLRGQNVILKIALTTCSVCIETHPVVEQFKEKFGDKVKVLTVFPNESKQQVENFFKNNRYPRDEEVIAGEGMNSIIYDYQVKYTPTFLFIDKEGYIQFVHIGSVDEVMLSSMSDLAFKTNLTESFNQTVEVDAKKPQTTPSSPTPSNKK